MHGDDTAGVGQHTGPQVAFYVVQQYFVENEDGAKLLYKLYILFAKTMAPFALITAQLFITIK